MNKKPETLEELIDRVGQQSKQVQAVAKQLKNKQLMPRMRHMLEEDLNNYEHGLQHTLGRLRAYLKKHKEQLMQEHYRLSSDLWEAAMVHDVHQVASLDANLKQVNAQLKAYTTMIATQEFCINLKAA